MTDNGYVYAYRRAWKHPAFRDLLDGAIWNYLYQNASWRDETVIVNGQAVELKRGQIYISLRYLAEQFGTSVSRIRSHTDMLTERTMIHTQPTHRGTIVTICNYEIYQNPEEDVRTLDAHSAHTESHTGRTYNKVKEIKETNIPPKNVTLEMFRALAAELKLPADIDIQWNHHKFLNNEKSMKAKDGKRAARNWLLNAVKYDKERQEKPRWKQRGIG